MKELKFELNTEITALPRPKTRKNPEFLPNTSEDKGYLIQDRDGVIEVVYLNYGTALKAAVNSPIISRQWYESENNVKIITE